MNNLKFLFHTLKKEIVSNRQHVFLIVLLGLAFFTAWGVKASPICTQDGAIPSGYYDSSCIFHILDINGVPTGQTAQLVSTLTPSPVNVSLGQSTLVTESISQATYGIPDVGVDGTPDCNFYATTSGAPVLLGLMIPPAPQPNPWIQSTTTYPTATTTYSTVCGWVGYNSTGDMNAYPSLVNVTNTIAPPVNVGSCTSPPNMCGQTVSGICPQNTPPPKSYVVWKVVYVSCKRVWHDE